MRTSVLGRLDDLEKTVKTELKTRKNTEQDLHTALNAHQAQMKTYVDESVDATTKMIMVTAMMSEAKLIFKVELVIALLEVQVPFRVAGQRAPRQLGT